MIRSLIVCLGLMGSVFAAPRPNVILVITDDLGYGDLSCYGQKTFETPNIDRLASEGIRFTDHYSGSTVCAPSRTCLMTGMDTGHAGIRGNGVFELRPDPLDRTVASILREAGYSTGLIGKSCVTGNTQTPETLKTKGFDYFCGTTSHVDGHFRFPKFVYENDKRIELKGNTLYDGPFYDLDLYTKKSLEFLDRQGDKPFLMVLSYPVPHATLYAPEDSMARVRPNIRDEKSYNPKKVHYGRVKELKASYAAMVVRVDDAVGSIMKKLKAKGFDENTLVMFTSDNGSYTEGGYRYEMLDSNGIMRGGKRDLYEGGTRVPLVARWPKGIKPGRTTDHISAFWDFMPTLCDLAGAEAPSDIQGLSYAPVLTGDDAGQKKHEALYWEFHEMGGRRALRMGQWKLVQYSLKPGKFGKPQLFDLSKDVSERKNIAKQHPERVKDMVKRMNRSRVPSKRFPMKGLDALAK